jgi:hypothetical protein
MVNMNPQQMMMISQMVHQIQNNEELREQFVEKLFNQLNEASHITGKTVTKEEVREKLNDPQFLATLLMGIQNEANGMNDQLTVTSAEKEQIEQIAKLGFNMPDVIQAYKVCNGNVDQTVSLLYSMKEKDNNDSSTNTSDFNEIDKANIKEFVNMGFPEDKVIECYIVCDKDKEATANMLLDD